MLANARFFCGRARGRRIFALHMPLSTFAPCSRPVAPGPLSPARGRAAWRKRCCAMRFCLRLALLLLVLRIFADDHYAALALDYLALFADFLYGRLYFHSILPPFFFYRAEPQTFYIHSFIMTYPLSSWYAT